MGADRRNALTLLELVVGLVLLASLLVSSLLALARQQSSLRDAEDRLLAGQLADELLASWHHSPHGIPLRGMGPITTQRTWLWKTDVVRQQTVFGNAMAVVQLNIIRSQQDRQDVVLQIETLASLVQEP